MDPERNLVSQLWIKSGSDHVSRVIRKGFQSVGQCQPVQFTPGAGKLSVKEWIVHIFGFSGHLLCHTQ